MTIASKSAHENDDEDDYDDYNEDEEDDDDDDDEEDEERAARFGTTRKPKTKVQTKPKSGSSGAAPSAGESVFTIAAPSFSFGAPKPDEDKKVSPTGLFSTSGPSAFSTGSSSSLFGTTSTPSSGSGSSIFGQTSAFSQSPAAPALGNSPVFGQTSTSFFGQKSVFGSQNPENETESLAPTPADKPDPKAPTGGKIFGANFTQPSFAAAASGGTGFRFGSTTSIVSGVEFGKVKSVFGAPVAPTNVSIGDKTETKNSTEDLKKKIPLASSLNPLALPQEKDSEITKEGSELEASRAVGELGNLDISKRILFITFLSFPNLLIFCLFLFCF